MWSHYFPRWLKGQKNLQERMDVQLQTHYFRLWLVGQKEFCRQEWMLRCQVATYLDNVWAKKNSAGENRCVHVGAKSMPSVWLDNVDCRSLCAYMYSSCVQATCTWVSPCMRHVHVQTIWLPPCHSTGERPYMYNWQSMNQTTSQDLGVRSYWDRIFPDML